MKKFFCLTALILGVILGACTAQSVSAEQDSPIKIYHENKYDQYHTLKVVDDETGVNYIVVSLYTPGTGYSVSITPRLNANGELYITE